MNENYEKYRKAVTILLIIVVFSGIWTIIFKAKYENIKNSYVSETGVYTPSGIPDEYHNELSIDIFEYWVYELNKSEQKEKRMNNKRKKISTRESIQKVQNMKKKACQ